MSLHDDRARKVAPVTPHLHYGVSGYLNGQSGSFLCKKTYTLPRFVKGFDRSALSMCVLSSLFLFHTVVSCFS